MWIKADKELPKELFTYGRESGDVFIASKCPYSGYWQYGVAYVARTIDDVEWVSSNGQKLNRLPDYWCYIIPPEN